LSGPNLTSLREFDPVEGVRQRHRIHAGELSWSKRNKLEEPIQIKERYKNNDLEELIFFKITTYTNG
jgi:hypothetical protein